MAQEFTVGQRVRINVKGEGRKVGVIREVYVGLVVIFVEATNELISTPTVGLEVVKSVE